MENWQWRQYDCEYDYHNGVIMTATFLYDITQCYVTSVVLFYLSFSKGLRVPYPPSNTKRISANWKTDLWENWGGQVHPSPSRGDATGIFNLSLHLLLTNILLVLCQSYSAFHNYTCPYQQRLLFLYLQSACIEFQILSFILSILIFLPSSTAESSSHISWIFSGNLKIIYLDIFRVSWYLRLSKDYHSCFFKAFSISADYLSWYF